MRALRNVLLAIATVLAMPLWSAKEPLPNPWWGMLHPAAPTVKVLIAKDADQVDIAVSGPYRVFNPADCTISSSGVWGKDYPAKATLDGVKWGEEYIGTFQIAIVPGAQASITVDGVAYPGSMYVYAVDGRVNVVNHVNVEEFLKDTLSTQYDCAMQDEALAALAIAARTQAYYQASRNKDAYYQFEASQVGYTGLNCMYKKGVERAVNATRFVVMRQCDTAACGGLFAATWTEHCAGRTAAPQAVWRKEMNCAMNGVESALAASDRSSTAWTFLIKKSDLAKQVGVSDVTAVSAYQDPSSGKVCGVRVQGASGTKEMDFVNFQKLVGKEKLLSSDFSVVVEGDVVTFTGYGKGPGTGLCLWTANKMAEHGLDAVKVLRKFFPTTQVQMTTQLP